jgi:hypothetical protein
MANVRSNMRAVMRTQTPLLSSEQIWKEKFLLLRELMEFMTPLFVLMRTGQQTHTRYYIVVPPDDELADFITEGEAPMNGSFAAKTARCAQAAVRAHILHGADPSQLSSLLGFSAVLTLEPPAQQGPVEGSSRASLFSALGSVSVADPHGNCMSAEILAVERLVHAGPQLPLGTSGTSLGCTLLFVNKAVYSNQRQRPKLPMTAKLLAQKCRMSMIPMWQRLPNSAALFVASAERSDVTTSVLLSKFESDEKSFRTLISDFAAEKVESLDNPEHKRRVSQLVDDAMMQMETEVTMFRTSYLCVDGYETYIKAKVMQIIETAVETVLDVREDTEWVEVVDREDLWTDDEKEQVIVSVHTVVSGEIASKVLRHWEGVHHNEDFAFHHACCSLQQRLTLSELVRVPGIEQVPPGHFDAAVAVVSVLNSHTLSVFSMMRVMETAISVVVELLQTCGVMSDVTADLAIPLMVFVIVQARPTALPSRIRYILDMSVPSLEMSSLGYALTTFEASAAHVLEEYVELVSNR